MLAFRMFQTLRTKSQRTEEVVATTFDYTSPKHTWNASIRRFDTKFEVGVCPCTSAIDRQASVKFFSLNKIPHEEHDHQRQETASTGEP